jgi:hypothetical protein
LTKIIEKRAWERNGPAIVFERADSYEPIRFTNRQWLKQKRVEKTKDCGVRPDAKGERNDRCKRKRRSSREVP